MATIIRSATPDDASLLHEVAAATFALACPPDTTQASIDAFIADNLSLANFDAYLADPNRALLLAMVDDVPTAYAMVNFGEPADQDVVAAVRVRPTSELSKLYLLPGQHGSGIARDLLEAAIVAAANRGAVAMWLGTNQQNGRANRFYEKNGFALVGTKKFLVGGRLEDDNVRERVF